MGPVTGRNFETGFFLRDKKNPPHTGWRWTAEKQVRGGRGDRPKRAMENIGYEGGGGGRKRVGVGEKPGREKVGHPSGMGG